MEELVAYRAELLATLGKVVRDLRAVATKQAALIQHQPMLSGVHTPHYFLFQLRELEKQVFSLHLPRFLAEQNLVIPAFDDQAWMRQYYNPGEPIQAILDELTRLRNKELEWLKTLSPSDWSRTARHVWWGVHTLQWWVELQLEWSIQHLRKLANAA